MARIGYARVSTLDQNPELQLKALEAAGCERTFTDHGVSGSKASREQLDEMLKHLRKGDEVVVWKLDRLGRNTRNLLELVDQLESRGVHFQALTEGISTTGPMGRAMLTVMSAFAQLERDQLIERTKAGMAVAKSNGRKAGRREVTAEDEAVAKAKAYHAKGNSVAEIQKLIGASRATVYRYLKMGTDQ
jgi:DNA invertase Pin-like site-specific DNA recombinase